MNIIQERYELAKTRIMELPKEIEGEYEKYILQITELFQNLPKIKERNAQVEDI